MEPGAINQPAGSEWKQLFKLGEQLVRLPDTQAQRQLVEETVSEIMQGEARLWLAKPYYPLPDEHPMEVLPSAPAPDLVHRANLTVTPLCCDEKENVLEFDPACLAVEVAVPLVANDAMLGVLELRRPPDRPLDAGDFARIDNLAQAVALGLEMSRQEKLKNWRYDQLALVRQVSAQIASLLDIDRLCEKVTTLIQQTFHFYYVAIFARDDRLENGESLVFRAAAHSLQNQPIPPGARVQFGEGLIGTAAQSGEQIVVADVLIDPRYKANTSLSDTLSEACFPLKVENQFLGVLDIQSDKLDDFHEVDLLVLAGLADSISLAMQNAHLYSDLKLRASQVSSLFEISHALNSILDYERLLEEIISLIQKRFGYPHIHIYSVHRGRRLAIFQFGSGERSRAMRDQMVSYSLDSTAGIISHVARTGKTYIANDVANEPLYIPAELPPYDTRAELTVPLKVGDDVIGVLDIQSSSSNSFNEGDRSLYEALASTVAIAYRNADLYRSEIWRRQVAESFRDVAYHITNNTNLDSLLDLILSRLEANLPCDAAAIWLMEDEMNSSGDPHHPLRLAAVRGAKAEALQKVMASTPEIFDQLTNLLLEGQPYIRDPKDAAGPLGTALQFNADYSSIVAPMHIGDQPLGLVTLVHKTAGRYGSEASSMTASFASFAAAAIQNTRLVTESQQQAWVSTMLVQVAEASQTTLSLDDLLATMLRLTRLLVGVRKCAFLLRDEGVPRFELKAWYGITPPAGTTVWVPDTAPALVRLDTDRVPLFLTNPREELGLWEMDLSSQVGTIVMLPLLVRSELIGAYLIALQTTRSSLSEKAFDPKMLAILQGIAHQTSLTVENLRLLDARQEEAYVTAALLQVAQAIVSAGELEEVLENVVHLLPILVGVDVCVIYLWDKASQVFRPAKAHAEDHRTRQVLLETIYEAENYPLLDAVANAGAIHLCQVEDLDETPLAWATLECKPLNTLAESAILPTGAWLLGFPLNIQGQVLGVLVTREPNTSPAFWERRMEIITGIAQQTSLAIQNDLLKHEMVQNERMEREIQLARQIQETFLPDRLPEPEGWELDVRWETAREVGGDFYDVVDLGDNRLGLVIADVSDKGLPAALYMTVSRTLIHSKLREHDNPADVLKDVNILLFTESPESMFITAVYAVLNLASGELIYANAGHNLPLLFRSSTQQVEQLPKGGMALGVLPEIELLNHSIMIQPGDSLVFYTDGASDTLSPEGETFGENRLRDLLTGNCCESAAALLEQLDQTLVDFRRDLPPVDDVTLIALRRQSL